MMVRGIVAHGRIGESSRIKRVEISQSFNCRVPGEVIKVVLDMGVSVAGDGCAVARVVGIQAARPFPGVRHAVMI